MRKITFYTLLLSLCFHSYSQIGFQEIEITGFSNAYGLTASAAAGDLDGDGDIDVVTSHYDGFPGLVWYKNTDGQGTFGYQRPVSSDFDSASSNIITKDIDNDGDLDIFASTNSSIVWFENTDGLGNFSTTNIITQDVDRVTSIRSVDIDGDGDLDLISTSYNDKKLAWYENIDGLGNFGAQQIITIHSLSWALAYGEDMDGDGDMDIIASLDDIVWFENTDGNGAFTIEHQISSIDYKALTPKDIDGDGDIDIIIPAGYNDHLIWYENINGSGNFSSIRYIDTSINGDVDITNADDLDGDGDVDILIDGNGLFLYLNNGNNSFSGGLNILNNTNSGVNAIEILDIDGDNDLDILAGSGGHGLIWLENTNGMADFVQNTISFSAEDPDSSFLSDLDNDGDIDILTTANGQIAWFENLDGNQNYEIQHNIYNNLYMNIKSASAFDLDGDNDMDIIGSITGDDKIIWFENVDGQGTFENQTIITFSCDAPIMTHASDIDGDGDLDLLSASYNDDKIAWYENLDGQGTFGVQQLISTNANYAIYVKGVDIDMDGDIDVVSASRNDDKIAWYENTDGLGTFSSEKIISSQANSIRSIDIKDIDGDGDLDILSGSSSETKIAWFENLDGLGNFSSENILAPDASLALSVFFEDVDNDGDLDAVSLTSSRKIVWFENINGNFDNVQQEISPTLNSDPIMISGDLDQDGDIDFISGSSTAYNGRVKWHKNLGLFGNQINGTVTYNINNDDCNTGNWGMNNIMINADNGNDSFSTFTLSSGGYELPVNEGNFTTTISSNLPSYFAFNPTSVNSSFTGIGNSDIANFCITPNTIVNDLSISIYPSINEPRPGFDTTYRIVYKNLGTTQLSGNVTFEYDNTKLQFLNASETVNSQTSNSLTFNYSNLNPFETRVIDLQFNVFAPPTTNIGEVLSTTATINPVTGDNTEEDNVFTLEQTVIGSYDPNDIQVLEGDQILLEDVDKYLHYIIRFQNTGTASAINVNVENVLDANLDWTTMQLESLSHDGRVEIRDGNMVNFIFNYINLPDSTSDEPNSHGFIAYKIKPKSTVAIGDIMYNKADIFFDFNPPIITNTVSTEIVETLSVNEFAENEFSIYPNPTKDIIHINGKERINKLSIHDLNGRLLKEIKLSNSQTSTEVAINNYAIGLYFLSIETDKGIYTHKIIKK
ncbi:hypothetical protein IMCC3317_13020 [Kordia antarctica]|uniref:Secretion system C-terminal sorting domain-containing protein n=1 Tax=Kordia antarctica TaxID=1218801 RepID=A0A7L4ZJ50_9FLAO|nr:T9SS type A sorting domain-containing protein [Kordia antarctica]QHI35954.1 hypothetical protein IMCC3317_13020 [Kordia antarctica]